MNYEQLKKFHFCFLNVVYVDSSDAIEVYEVVFSDSNFQETALLRVELPELLKISSSGFVTDFNFKEDFLVCNPHVSRLRNSSIVAKTLDRLICVKHADTIYDLLYEGLQNDFYVISDSYAESIADGGVDDENGFCFITHFRNIRFSRSSMTVYVPMRKQDGLYNKMLIVPENKIMKMNAFYFIADAGYALKTNDFSLVSQIDLNNKKYNLYLAEMLRIYDASMILAGPLINKACCLRQRVYNASTALDEFRNEIWLSLEGKENGGMQWAGGNNCYTSWYGVQFTNSIPVMTKKQKKLLRDYVLDKMVMGCMTVSEFKKAVSSSKMDQGNKFVCMCFAYALAGADAEDSVGLLDSINAYNDKLKDMLFRYDLFLYRIRLYVYVSHESLIHDWRQPILFGGNETDYTTVQEGFYYESV